MPQANEVALTHLRARASVTDRAATRLLRMWGQFSLNNLDLSWDIHAPLMVATVTRAQVAAAAQADKYVAQVAAVNGSSQTAQVVPEAFGGVALDGREIGPAMYGAVTTTKKLIGAGRPPQEAFAVGAAFLATVVGSAVQDMGRQADMVGGVKLGYTHYVRVLSPGACSRCAVLAGKSSAEKAFRRHPRCKCGTWPVSATGGVTPNGIPGSPEEYFEGLTRAEQNRVFTNAGAEAIRSGANPISVVNARRGAYGIGYNGHYNTPVPVGTHGTLRPVIIGVRADGSPLRVYATTEGTTARGRFGRQEISLTGQATREGRYRRTTTVRLMPEQIAVMAGGNQTRWVELLQKYGYLY